jgi:hypothetical protein
VTAKNKAARELARLRWKDSTPEERSAQVPRNGGRPRKYPVVCSRYHAHRFSPYTGRCPCGYVRPLPGG